MCVYIYIYIYIHTYIYIYIYIYICTYYAGGAGCAEWIYCFARNGKGGLKKGGRKFQSPSVQHKYGNMLFVLLPFLTSPPLPNVTESERTEPEHTLRTLGGITCLTLRVYIIMCCMRMFVVSRIIIICYSIRHR